MQALIGRAQARIALRDTDGAGADIEQAHGLEREDANGLCEYGIVLRSRGSLSEAIEMLRRAAAVGGRDDTDYHLAVTLRERDEPGDLQEADRAADARDLAARRDSGGRFTIRSGLRNRSAGERSSAITTPTRCSRRLPRTGWRRLRCARCARISVSRRANSIRPRSWPTRPCRASRPTPRRQSPQARRAAPRSRPLSRRAAAVAALAPAGTTGTDTRRLLDCAARLGREDIVTEITRQLHPEKAIDAGSVPISSTSSNATILKLR